MQLNQWSKGLLISTGLLVLTALPAQAQQPYIVLDGHQLDSETFNGFRLYRNWCARCHGTFGQGMAGPNLADSLKRIDKQEFMDVVEHGKTGQLGMMPAWSTNQQVMDGREQIYRYLKARADGAIGEVRPERAP